jgi:hypothetical protein
VHLFLALRDGLFINSDQLPGREQREVALGGLKDKIEFRELELCASGVGLRTAFGYSPADAAEVEQVL